MDAGGGGTDEALSCVEGKNERVMITEHIIKKNCLLSGLYTVVSTEPVIHLEDVCGSIKQSKLLYTLITIKEDS